MTDSEKLDILLRDIQDVKRDIYSLKKNYDIIVPIVPIIERMDSQIQFISNRLLSPQEARQLIHSK